MKVSVAQNDVGRCKDFDIPTSKITADRLITIQLNPVMALPWRGDYFRGCAGPQVLHTAGSTPAPLSLTK